MFLNREAAPQQTVEGEQRREVGLIQSGWRTKQVKASEADRPDLNSDPGSPLPTCVMTWKIRLLHR